MREEGKPQLSSEEQAGEANQSLSGSLELPVERGGLTKKRPVVWQSVGLARSDPFTFTQEALRAFLKRYEIEYDKRFFGD